MNHPGWPNIGSTAALHEVMRKLHPLYGCEIHCSVLMTEHVYEVKSVRGGYMNRWWIRQIIDEHRPSKVVTKIGNCLYMHPETLKALNAAFEAKGFPPVKENKNPTTDYVRSLISNAIA